VLLAGGCVVVGGFAVMWSHVESDKRRPAGAAKVDAAVKVYTRQEFRDLVMGKTEDEVIAAVGKPDETTEDGDAIRWTYEGRVRDPGPGQPAATPVVVFREGKAAEVQY
jgi:hypothetical protein